MTESPQASVCRPMCVSAPTMCARTLSSAALPRSLQPRRIPETNVRNDLSSSGSALPPGKRNAAARRGGAACPDAVRLGDWVASMA